MTVTGRCLCGDVVWQTTEPLDFMHHCHCSRCRKSHGTAFATYALSAPANFRLLGGGDGIVRYASSPGFTRAFCGRCGSVVPEPGAAGDWVGIPIGSLDDDPGVRPIGHIFVGSKAPWYAIPDALPQFDAYPPDVDAPVLGKLPEVDAPGPGVRGSCVCGAVAFVVTGAPVRCQHCHCSRCRRARSAAHASNFFTALDGVRFVRGEERLRSYKVPEARFFKQIFCDGCGAPMPRHDPDRNIAVVPLGSLDDDPPMRPQWHIYVGSKAPWFDIADALPQHPEGPPAA